MAYITKSNSRRILKKINFNEIQNITGEVYKKPIYFLSKWETKYLLLMQTLLKEPEKFALEVYRPIVNKDTFRYVFENEQSPSYHFDKNCKRLNSNFKNFVIPIEIKERARKKAKNEGKTEQETIEIEKQQVEVFRLWFKNNIELFEKDTEKFLKKLEIRWNIQRNINEIEKDNSGTETIDNLNLAELESEIDKLIREAGRYFTTNKDKQHLIRRFQKLTFLAYTKEEIKINDTELTDDELKSFLLEYDSKFKRPIFELLIQYYRVKYNPELSFDGQLLERLNFNPCLVCAKSSSPLLNNPELDKNDYILSENILLENKEFFNQFFSTTYPFTEQQLFDFYGKLKVGHPSMIIGSEGFRMDTIFGLIYNPRIRWTEKIQKLYYDEPRLLWAGSGKDEYSFDIKFNKLPLDIVEEVDGNKSVTQNIIIEHYGYGYNNGDSLDFLEGMEDELEDVDKEFEKIFLGEKFSDEEILKIIKNNNVNYFCNQIFCESLKNKIFRDINIFSIEVFYSKIEINEYDNPEY